MLLASGAGWAAGKNKAGNGRSAQSGKDDKEPASFNKTFQWEEKVVGPKEHRIDRDKIAAMQEQGRRDDAAKRREPPKKPERPQGVNGPAAAVIPTQDIEKPSTARAPLHKAAYVSSKKADKRADQKADKKPDAVDDLLAENNASGRDSAHEALSTIVGPSRHKPTKHGKAARSRR